MGTIYKKICIICFTALAGLSAHAQVSTLYTFSQFPGTYSAISGGTAFPTSALDDQDIVDPIAAPINNPSSGAGIDLGFNFVFDNFVYDRIGFSNNGYLLLGNSADGATAVQAQLSDWNRPISSTSTTPPKNQHRIAGLGTDLLGTATSEIRVQTFGAAPVRTTVIQWANYQFFTPTPVGDNVNFQIKLYETTNIIDVVYGTVAPVSMDSCGQVGLRGSTNADFNNRSVSPPATWATSLPGTANNYFVRYNPTLLPASGLTYRWTLPQCSGILAATSATGTTNFVCPNEAFALSMANGYTVSGITYTWSSSTALGGPYTPVANSNANNLNIPSIPSPMYYRVGATCINSSSSVTSTPFYVQLAGTTTNSVPYYEGFEGVTTNNRLPNCSWAASNLGITALTATNTLSNNRVARTGTKYASFFQTPAQDTYFYTNGIQMTAGTTYSANLWYTTEYLGYNNWTQLSISVGQSQSTTGLAQIVSVGPALSGPYKSLGATFTVPTTGIYYLAIKGTSGAGLAQYMTWDDLSVTYPCTGPGALNSPTVSLGATSTSVCQGVPVTLSAFGADTYTWNTGSNLSSFIVTPDSTSIFSVTGTNSLTGCSETKTETISIIPSPVIYAVANPPIVCPGTSAILSASGGNAYQWNVGGNTSVVMVTVTAASIYTVTGTNTLGCSATTTVQVVTYASPSVTASGTIAAGICKDEPLNLTASGVSTYTWIANQTPVVMIGNMITVYPQTTTIYTVTGTDANGCKQSVSLTQTVSSCTGLNKLVGNSLLNIYPNPTSGDLTVESADGYLKTIEVMDLSGRQVMLINSNEQTTVLSLTELVNGIYFLKITSDQSSEVIKIIKQ